MESDLKSAWKVNEWLVMALVGLSSALGVLFFGYTMFFFISAMLLPIFFAAALFFMQGACTRRMIFPPGFWVFSAVILYVAGLHFSARVPYVSMMTLLQLLGWIVAYWIWSTYCRSWDRCRWIWAALLILLSGVCWYAVWRHFNANVGLYHDQHQVMQFGSSHYKTRASGSFVCPNHFASLIVMGICVAAGLLSMKSGVWLKLLSAQYLIVSFPCLIQSGSRSGWIGVVVGLTVLFALLLWKKSKIWCVITMLLFLVGAAGCAYLLWKYVPFIQDRISSGSAGRLTIWPKVIEMIKERPLTGWGVRMFRYTFPPFKDGIFFANYVRYAHNEYVHLAAETGLIGLGLTLLLAVVWYVRWMINYVRSLSWETTVLSAIALSAVTATLAHAMFDFNITTYANTHVMLLIIGTAAGAGFTGMRKHECTRPKTNIGLGTLGIAGSVLVFALTLILFMNLFHTYMGNRKLYVAKDYEAALSSYDKAEEWYSGYWRTYYHRGVTYRRLLKRPDLSMDEYNGYRRNALIAHTRAYEINPSFSTGVSGLSEVFKLYGKSAMQQALLAEVIALDPDKFYWNRYFKALKYRGDMDEINEACRLTLQAKAFTEHGLRSMLRKVKITGVDLKAMAKSVKENPADVPRRIFVDDDQAMVPLYMWEYAEDGSVINWDHKLLKK